MTFQIVVNAIPEKTMGELCVPNSRNRFFVYVKDEYKQVPYVGLLLCYAW